MGSKQSVVLVVLYLGCIQNTDRSGGSNLGNVSDVKLPGSPGIVIYQDHYGGYYRKKNGLPCNDAIEI
jgi:hypothetical protein